MRGVSRFSSYYYRRALMFAFEVAAASSTFLVNRDFTAMCYRRRRFTRPCWKV